jgi:hypothetical protein
MTSRYGGPDARSTRYLILCCGHLAKFVECFEDTHGYTATINPGDTAWVPFDGARDDVPLLLSFTADGAPQECPLDLNLSFIIIGLAVANGCQSITCVDRASVVIGRLILPA